MTEDDVEELMQNAGKVRNRPKIRWIIKNAKAHLQIESAGISFSGYIWFFVEHKTTINSWSTKHEVSTSTEQSDRMAKDFPFVMLLCKL
jgi:DNA-3-methyladenine glycosylase I